MFTRIPTSQRVHFIDGPARGRTLLTAERPALVTWQDACGAHRYRRMTNAGAVHLYSYVR